MNTDFEPQAYMPLLEQERAIAAARSRRQPHLGYTLLLLLIGCLALLVLSLLVTSLGIRLHLLPHDPAALTHGYPKTNILVELLTFAATFAIAAALFPHMWHRGFAEVIEFNRRTAARFAGWLALGGVGLSLVAQLLESKLHLDKKMPIDDFFQHPADVWVVALFGTLVAPLCEEVFFRGFLLRGLAIAWDWCAARVRPSAGLTVAGQHLPDSIITTDSTTQWNGLSRTAWIVAGVISSGLFAAMHAKQLGFAWSAVGVLWLVGGVLTTVRIRLNSVAASTVVHVVYNGWIFVIIFFVTGGFRHLDKLSR